MVSLLKFSRGHNSVKNVGGVTILVLCTSPEYIIFVTSFMKISQRVSELLSGHDFVTDGHIDRRPG